MSSELSFSEKLVIAVVLGGIILFFILAIVEEIFPPAPLFNPQNDTPVVDGVLKDAVYHDGTWQLTLEFKVDGKSIRHTTTVNDKYRHYDGFNLGEVYTIYRTYQGDKPYEYVEKSAKQSMPDYGVYLEKTVYVGEWHFVGELNGVPFDIHECAQPGWEQVSP